jgi:hypothetical protein
MENEKLVQLVITIDPKTEALEASVWINEERIGKGFYSHFSEFTVKELLTALMITL